ncbi:hypothetical protein OSB04_017227 [Centaurea solstitialis]|uniref:Retrotransposon gag domain-containing protein n=1 Tax=Centaurea solstitialis TaxID=347529 RepID=A0AA38TKL5_9ASTR|nr:hypothetical protein OSB04_017227 [Centaurea solstitialis]
MWTTRRAAPTVPTNPITKPDLNKEIPGKLLHMIKDLTFDGKNDSNPIVHMENFVDICDLFKTEEGRDDAIRLRVFPLTLTGEARAWLRSLEPSSITTWEGLRSKFLSRFFPPSKIDKLRAEIRSFKQDDGETISEAWERFKYLLNSCPSHGLNKSEQVQTFYSGLAYSSRATLDSSAGGVFMYKTPTEGYKLLEDMLIHNIDWRTDKRLQIPRMARKISTDFDPSDELAAMKTNRGDYQGRWNNNHNFIPRPPGFFAPNQQNQRPDGEPRVSIEDRILQFMDMQKKLNDEVSSYLRNHQSTIQNLELQVGRVSQMLSERTQGELPTQTHVNPKVENVKPMLMMTGEPSKKKWTDIYTKKYVESDSGSEPDYAMDYDSEGFTISFEHLGLKGPVASSDDEEEDGKQGGYAEFMIPKKEDKGKEKEKEKAPEDDLIHGTQVNDRGWKSRYVFVQTSSVTDDESWVVPEWNSNAVSFTFETTKESTELISHFLSYSVTDSTYRTLKGGEESDVEPEVQVIEEEEMEGSASKPKKAAQMEAAARAAKRRAGATEGLVAKRMRSSYVSMDTPPKDAKQKAEGGIETIPIHFAPPAKEVGASSQPSSKAGKGKEAEGSGLTTMTINTPSDFMVDDVIRTKSIFPVLEQFHSPAQKARMENAEIDDLDASVVGLSYLALQTSLSLHSRMAKIKEEMSANQVDTKHARKEAEKAKKKTAQLTQEIDSKKCPNWGFGVEEDGSDEVAAFRDLMGSEDLLDDDDLKDLDEEKTADDEKEVEATVAGEGDVEEKAPGSQPDVQTIVEETPVVDPSSSDTPAV